MACLLALTDGQVLTSLPGVKAIRAACLSAFTLPIARFPTAEHLYSATGLAPASYQSSSIDRRSGISRPRHRRASTSMLRHEPLELVDASPKHRQRQRIDNQPRGVRAQPDPVLHLARVNGHDERVHGQRPLQ